MNKKQALSRRDFLKLAGIAAATSALAACNSGGSQKERIATDSPVAATQPAGSFAAPHATGEAASAPVASGDLPPLSVIVLNRIAFGPRPGDLAAFEALGNDDESRLQAYIEQQLDPDSIDDRDFEARFAAARFETLHKTLEELASDHIVNNPYDDNDDRNWEWFIQPVDELTEVVFLRAVYSNKQLTEVLADFWHNHFNVYCHESEIAPLFVSYDRDVIRKHLMGNFREFLEAVATHPSMLYYLDNYINSDAGPNENYARELFELHTLGAENYLGVRDPNTVEKDANGIAIGYVDNDVYEAARCFTGWRVDDDLWDEYEGVGTSGRFVYYRPWHDRFNKIVLGRYIPADQPDMKDGHDVLDILATHPGTARFIARKLCRRLVGDDPPESLVQKTAETFLAHKNAPDQLKHVYATILLSDEFRQTWGEKIKRPFEIVTASMRALNADFTRLTWDIQWLLGLMGQPVFERHTPDGYPDTKNAWANTMTTLYGWNLAIALTENWFDEDEKAIRVDILSQTPETLRSAAALADYWLQQLVGPTVSNATRQAVIGYIAQDRSPDEILPQEDIEWLLPGMVGIILMSPEFRLR